MFTLFRRKGDSQLKLTSKNSADNDFLNIVRENPESFASLEHQRTHKPIDEILREINLGLRINNLNFDESFTSKKTMVIIPPKYELWLYFLLAIRLSHLGYKVLFLYHNWSNNLIESIKPTLSYLKYQNLTIENAEDYAFSVHDDVMILNFADSYKGIKTTVPSFSTAIVDKNSDLDYVMAYILANAFSFAGMKKSNLKRIIVDESIKDVFEQKIFNRMAAISEINSAKITSHRFKEQIHEIVSEAISEGADLILGGDNFDVDNFRNIILNNVTREMRVFQKSFYGPVLQLSYCSFEPRPLSKMIMQQPSRGIVVFTNDKTFIDLHKVCFKNKEYVVRPLENGNYTGIVEYNPTLEVMFKLLGIKE
jgi:hypothetical protein